MRDVLGSAVTTAAAAARSRRGPARSRSRRTERPSKPCPLGRLSTRRPPCSPRSRRPPALRVGETRHRLGEEPLVEVEPAEHRELGFGPHVRRERVTGSSGGTYGGLQTTASSSPRSSAGRGSSRSPSRTVTRQAEGFRVLARQRRRPRARGRWRAPSRPGARPRSPARRRRCPWPTSTTTGVSTPARAHRAPPDEDLGLRPRDEHAGADADGEPPEPLLAGHVLERLPDAPPAERSSEELRLLRRQPFPRVDPRPIRPEDVRQEPLGGGNRTLHAVPLQVLGRPPDDLRRPHVSPSPAALRPRPAGPPLFLGPRRAAPSAPRRSAAP